ncbi:hypothetical protein B0A54_14939 [Friedmanniomyces endolithicus]|uniref:Uncharacterized protein n=1 Tax=Friedmanniomyces endolithicus TaxID=329885 RepID=A0A4V5N542_9PEZI|nr:hypothetical protein B0A54_14939 [Friedmanniomyces endolithicus]
MTHTGVIDIEGYRTLKYVAGFVYVQREEIVDTLTEGTLFIAGSYDILDCGLQGLMVVFSRQWDPGSSSSEHVLSKETVEFQTLFNGKAETPQEGRYDATA